MLISVRSKKPTSEVSQRLLSRRFRWRLLIARSQHVGNSVRINARENLFAADATSFAFCRLSRMSQTGKVIPNIENKRLRQLPPELPGFTPEALAEMSFYDNAKAILLLNNLQF